MAHSLDLNVGTVGPNLRALLAVPPNAKHVCARQKMGGHTQVVNNQRIERIAARATTGVGPSAIVCLWARRLRIRALRP